MDQPASGASVDAPAQDAGTAAAEKPVSTSDSLYPNDRRQGVDSAPEPQEPAGEDQEGEEQAQGEEAAEPAITPPNSLSAEEKQAFASWPRDAQEVFTKRVDQLEKGFHAKAQEAAQAKAGAQREALGHVTTIQQQYAQQLQQYAQMFQPQAPDPRLLTAGNTQEERDYYRSQFYQQDAEFRQLSAQQQQLQQQAADAQRQAEQAQQESLRQQREAEMVVLAEKIPEWSDPAARANLLSDMETIADALGYPKDRLSEAGATDLLALKQGLTWKAKADKWDQYQRDKMAPVRAAKQLPRVTQPGAGGQAQQAPKDTAALLYPNDVRR